MAILGRGGWNEGDGNEGDGRRSGDDAFQFKEPEKRGIERQWKRNQGTERQERQEMQKRLEKQETLKRLETQKAMELLENVFSKELLLTSGQATDLFDVIRDYTYALDTLDAYDYHL